MQPNEWKHNVKHPNLIRLSETEIIFSYVGWDSSTQCNVFMRRSLDNGETWGEQVQISISEDGGDHWAKPAPTVLASPESPAIVKRIPTMGDLLVIWNNVASKSNWPRIPLTAAISRDEGETWTNFRDIDNRANRDAAYPSVTFVGNEALVAYYSRSTKWKRDAEITLRIYSIDQFYA